MGLQRPSVLDTYKQLLQPNTGAAFRPIRGEKMKASDLVLKPMIRAVRRDLYRPLDLASKLPIDPVLYVWLVRVTCWLDAPLRRVLDGGTYGAKTS